MTIAVDKPGNIDRDAARWVERMSAPLPPPDVARDFDRWIAADPQHAEHFGRMQALWGSDAFVQALGQIAWQRPRAHPLRQALDRWTELLRQPVLLPIGSALACMLIGAFLLPHAIQEERFGVAPGPARTIALADGTKVVLSGGGELQVRMTPWSRRATLARGEAFFDVAHERVRHFSIRSGGTQVEVLGTAFEVDHEAANKVSVRVYRGLVGIESADGSRWEAPAGTALRVAGNKGERLPAPKGSGPQWLHGWYETGEAPMRDLIQQLNRFSPKPIRLVDPRIGAIPVSGRFRIADTRMVLEALAATYDLRWHEDARGYRLVEDGPR